jgi:hypothetical protein
MPVIGRAAWSRSSVDSERSISSRRVSINACLAANISRPLAVIVIVLTRRSVSGEAMARGLLAR